MPLLRALYFGVIFRSFTLRTFKAVFSYLWQHKLIENFSYHLVLKNCHQQFALRASSFFWKEHTRKPIYPNIESTRTEFAMTESTTTELTNLQGPKPQSPCPKVRVPKVRASKIRVRKGRAHKDRVSKARDRESVSGSASITLAVSTEAVPAIASKLNLTLPDLA
jgi:hypothetical protein